MTEPVRPDLDDLDDIIDPRVREMIEDPDGYFERAYKRRYEEVGREMERERAAGRRPYRR